MSRFGNLRVPSLTAAVNVANQTFRQFMPERTNQNQPGERVRFAQVSQTYYIKFVVKDGAITVPVMLLVSRRMTLHLKSVKCR